KSIVLDMGSSVSPTHGEQEMSVWNGHYACTCYHPLFVFNQFGDLERCALRAGNVHSADGWDDVLKPVVARYQGKVSRIYFRADAAFAMPEVYEFLEAEPRSGYRPTRFCRAGSAICSRAHSDDLRTMCAGSMPISAIRPEPGPSCGGLSPRSSGSRRTLSPRRLHRDEHEPPGRARRCFLQQARDLRAMDQGGQRRDQVDATVVPNVRRQRGAAPASCARLQPRQFPAHAGDAGADQGLVTDKLEGQADQDRREGREPQPLHHLPDGRGRHRTANVPGDFAADRGTAAAAATSAGVRRSMVMHSRVADGRSASQMPGKIARSTPRPPFGPPVVRAAARSSRLASSELENRYYSRHFGSHLGNVGLDENNSKGRAPI